MVGALDVAELAKTKLELEREKKARLAVESLLAKTQLLQQGAEIARKNDNLEKLNLQKRVNELSAKVEMYRWKLGENQIQVGIPQAVKVEKKLFFSTLSSIDFESHVSASTRTFVLDKQGWALVGLEQAGQYGVLKVSFDGSIRQFIPLHQKCIRDLCLSPLGNGHLLSASMDKTLKICNASSTLAIVATFEVSQACWSCCWSETDPNFIFAGLQNNSIVQFDIRQPRTPIKSIGLNATCRGPQIRSMVWLPQQERLLVTDGSSIHLWSPNNQRTERVDMATSGSCLNISTNGSKILAAFRSLESPSIYVTMDTQQLSSNDPSLTRFFAQHPGSLLTKSCLFQQEDKVFVCASDERLLEVCIFQRGTKHDESCMFG